MLSADFPAGGMGVDQRGCIRTPFETWRLNTIRMDAATLLQRIDEHEDMEAGIWKSWYGSGVLETILVLEVS